MGFALLLTVISGAAALGCLVAWLATGAKNQMLQRLAGLFVIVCVLSYMLPRYL